MLLCPIRRRRSSTRSSLSRRSRFVCEVADPTTSSGTAATRAGSPAGPRSIIAATGVATRRTSGRGEFFVFDSVATTLEVNSAATRSTPQKAGKPRCRASATPCARRAATSRPRRTTRSPTCARDGAELERLGVQCEFHHHEVATRRQCEIDIRYQPLTRMADQVMLYKYVVRNVARRAGKTATFMPKPIFGDNGSGMHTHQSLWKEGARCSPKVRLRRPLGPRPQLRRRHPRPRPRCSRSARRRRTPSAASCRATRRP